MKSKFFGVGAAAVALAASFFTQTAAAVPVLCQEVNLNHMLVDSAYVSSCMGAGVGNINGNPATDAFIRPGGEGAGLGLVGIGSGLGVQLGSSGTFTINPLLWAAWDSIAIGFKFGTGNQPDEWFVYRLNENVSAGFWQFVNTFGRGGGLSHIQLYGIPGTTTNVPEPATLALFGLGLLGAGLARRRKQS